MVDECDEDFLSGDAGESEAVGGVALPDVEGAVCGGGEVDGASGALGAWGLVGGLLDDSLGGGLSEAGEALGWGGVCGWGGGRGVCGWWCVVGLVVVWGDVQLW